jgi:hypothetical protein
MFNEFAVDETGMTSDGYRRLQPSCKKAMYIQNAITMSVLTVIAVLGFFFLGDRLGTWYDTTLILTVAVLALIAVYLLVSPQVFYRRYRYRIDSEKAEIRRGVVTIAHVLVPIERIHQVVVLKGPINRMFGLANVNITTAGGTTILEYLDTETAESIAEMLNQTVVKLLKDRDLDG